MAEIGPNAYYLPSLVGYDNHDVTKFRGPRFSIKFRNSPKSQSSHGPGPAAYHIANLTRNGRLNAPAFHIGNLNNSTCDKSDTPGPGAYFPQKNSILVSSPSFYVGTKIYEKVREKAPSPNKYVYNMDSILKKSPSFTMSPRTNIEVVNQPFSPGPAAYNQIDQNVVKRSTPKYSISNLYAPPLEKITNPGPSTYNLQAYKPGDRGPSFSFGTKRA